MDKTTEKQLMKKEYDKALNDISTRDLTSKDLDILKKNKFNFKLIKLFSFYNKMKILCSCRKCEAEIRKSVNLNGFNTTVMESLEHCEKYICKVCMKSTEVIRANVKKEYEK